MRWRLALLALLGLGLVVWPTVARWYTDWLWFVELGYPQAFWVHDLSRAALFAFVAGVVWLVLYPNLRVALRSLPPLPEAAAVKELLRLHREALERCIRPDLFHGLARALGAAGEEEAAAALARRLLDCPLDPSLRLGILAGLVSSGDEEEALALVASQRGTLAPLDPQAAATLEAIEANVITRRLARLPEGSAARLETATRLLALRPDAPPR